MIDNTQIIAGLVALQPSIHAGEVSRWPHVQQPQQGPFRASQVAPFTQQYPFDEQQLDIFWAHLQAPPADGQGFDRLAQVAMALHDQGEQLADDGVLGVRQLQAAPQQG